jgi:prepilin peptidase CpaA
MGGGQPGDDMSVRVLMTFVPLIALLITAAVIDIRQRRIPNWLTFGLLFSGVLTSAIFSQPLVWSDSLKGIAAGFAVPFVLYALGALGGGDVKLMAGVGAWVGAPAALAVFVIQCLVGLVIVLTQAMAQRRTRALFRNTTLLACAITQRGVVATAADSRDFATVDRPLPYAVPVAIATLFVLCARIWAGA